MSDIGATESGWWQFWQLRCKMGAMSFVNVTSPGAASSATTSMRPKVMRAVPIIPSRRIDIRRTGIHWPPV
jgi:hypothetical protein